MRMAAQAILAASTIFISDAFVGATPCKDRRNKIGDQSLVPVHKALKH